MKINQIILNEIKSMSEQQGVTKREAAVMLLSRFREEGLNQSAEQVISYLKG